MKHEYSRWRHGGWYVHTVRYPSGAIGCVSNNYPDKKWRIVCDDRRVDIGAPRDFTFPTRDAAADAELAYVREQALTQAAPDMLKALTRFASLAACWATKSAHDAHTSALEAIEWEARQLIAKAEGATP